MLLTKVTAIWLTIRSPGRPLARFSHSSKKNGDTVSIEMRVRRSEAQRRTVSMPSLVLGSALAFFLRRSLQQLGLWAALRHRLIASLWRTRLSIAPTREKFGLSSRLVPPPVRRRCGPWRVATSYLKARHFVKERSANCPAVLRKTARGIQVDLSERETGYFRYNRDTKPLFSISLRIPESTNCSAFASAALGSF
jgi:hypothetical protein